MKVQFFLDSDTLYIEFKSAEVAETHDLDENTLLDFDAAGNLVSLTLEHSRRRANMPGFAFDYVPATPNNS